ncbi:SDR family NAD(P)-dependent oxidoreductase [Sinisalibacter lacisalsi]|uniref:Oxidoreductase n=1 Tax=Sinisalibacter lacisalsi TaxID=1526570 RepID=A0ABQ1QRV1_9RHOB|nr:SDR family NAD(P)-dependent oxidoreductase [Sinisalibacter lacisalsi]GGD39330.1 oxidoreductase [Sinisalibacter lacisalsi]
MHEAFAKGNVAVVTGGASGIGLEAAKRFAALGMKVCVADLPGAALDAAESAVSAAGAQVVLCVPTDVGDPDQIKALEARVTGELGPVNVLMNNAGIQPGSSIFDAEGNWQRIIDVNMWGIIRGGQVFAPGMIASGKPGLIINTGSKQGITTPPGDPAYNVSKTGVKAFTEALQHELRNIEGCAVEARLFIPGFVFTPLTAMGRTEKPASAWTPEEVVDYLFASLERDDFYILCPDNEVDRATDEKRIAWAAGDIIENRPPLSRWHPDFGDSFKSWLER